MSTRNPTHRSMKRRAPQGQLRNLSHDAREKLHAFFRENEGTLPLKDIAKRLAEEFDVKVSVGTLSAYYNDRYAEIVNGNAADPKAVTIRIEVPAGCRVNVSTEQAG